MANKAPPLPPGVYVIGKAIGDFTFRSGTSAKGNPYQLVQGQVLAGTQFVRITQGLEQGENPVLLRDGEDVVCKCIGDRRTGVLEIGVKLERPTLQDSQT